MDPQNGIYIPPLRSSSGRTIDHNRVVYSSSFSLPEFARNVSETKRRNFISALPFLPLSASFEMPHADSLALPPEATSSKSSFYTHVETTLLSLLAPNPIDRVQGNWVTQLANAAALLNGSYENYGQKFGRVDGRRVNWCGEFCLPSFPISPVY